MNTTDESHEFQTVHTKRAARESHLSQLRLFLEEICCDMCRFHHVKKDGVAPESVSVNREVYLGATGAYADIRVNAPKHLTYFVEVKYGYPAEKLIHHLRRKYGTGLPGVGDAGKVIVVTHSHHEDAMKRLAGGLREALPRRLKVEVWDEQELIKRVDETFGVKIQTLTVESLHDVREAIGTASGVHAFGSPYEHSPLESALLWHFGYWHLRRLRETRKVTPRGFLAPGLYHNVVVLLADLCAFSSYVRDTPDDELVRQCLTSFYSKARSEIINQGGVLYQFVGDEVAAFFGLPDHAVGYVENALTCARSLVDIGNSISHSWQRHIDRVQVSGGLHVGLAMGDVQVVSLRPFSRTHMGGIGDCINVAARLMATAGSSEIAVSNSFLQRLEPPSQSLFEETPPVEAHNVGRIKAWKLRPPGVGGAVQVPN